MKGLRGSHLVCGSHPATPSTEAGCSPMCVSPVKILCSHVAISFPLAFFPPLFPFERETTNFIVMQDEGMGSWGCMCIVEEHF